MTAEGKRDSWDKLAIILQPVGGLLTALAIALFGYFSSDFLNRRQAIETNMRLYSELMSRREESESALRKDMFQTIIGSFVNPNARGTDLNGEVLNLELLAYNFHESLNLKPLFIDLKRRIAKSEQSARSASDRKELEDFQERLERVAPSIERRQPIELDVVDVHVRVDLMRVVELEHVHLAEDLLPHRLVAQVVEQVEGAMEARQA